MPALTAIATAAVDYRTGTGPMLALREAVRAQLTERGALVRALGGADRIVWRYRRHRIEARLLTYFDFGFRPDATVPLLDGTWQFDVWGEDRAQATAIADLVIDVLDNRPMGLLPGGQARVSYLGLSEYREDLPQDGDIARAMLAFRMLAYRLT